MAYGSWSAVLNEYEMNRQALSKAPELSSAGRQILHHARAMLELIPRLQGESWLEDVIPGTSHATLFLRLPGHQTEVCIFYNDDSRYEVSFSHPEASFSRPKEASQTVRVDDEQLLFTLQDYVARLRNAISS